MTNNIETVFGTELVDSLENLKKVLDEAIKKQRRKDQVKKIAKVAGVGAIAGFVMLTFSDVIQK